MKPEVNYNKKIRITKTETAPEVKYKGMVVDKEHISREWSWCPRAIIRNGRWIATHLDYYIETFGMIGGPCQIGMYNLRRSEIKGWFGNRLQEGDIVVKLVDFKNKFEIYKSFIDNTRINGYQPKEDE